MGQYITVDNCPKLIKKQQQPRMTPKYKMGSARKILLRGLKGGLARHKGCAS